MVGVSSLRRRSRKPYSALIRVGMHWSVSRLQRSAMLVVLAVSPLAAQSLPYESMAARIVSALQVTRGERVLLRVDPNTMAQLAPIVRKALWKRGARWSMTLPYGPAPDFEARLAKTDVYVWLPAPATATPGRSGARPAALDRQRSLGASCTSTGSTARVMWTGCRRSTHRLTTVCMPLLSTSTTGSSPHRWIRPFKRLRSGEVRVTTPSGTDIRFRVGDRPFNKQDGDGSKARAAKGRIRIDRHIELPAGILRVAPLEESVTGVIVLPSARFGTEPVTDIRLEFAERRCDERSSAHW